MVYPSVIARIRQTLGRALRESGQALDRVGIRGNQHAITKRVVGDDPYLFDIPLSRHRNIMPLLKRGAPQIPDDLSFLAPCSSIIGNVQIGSQSSIWYGAVLRADSCCYGLGRSDKTYETWKAMPGKERLWKDHNLDHASGGGGIYIGCRTSIQDGSVITSRVDHVQIGDDVTVGHSAQIHSATINNHSLIGIGAIVSEGVTVGPFSIIAAGSVIPKNTVIKEGEVWMGNPATKCRDVTQEDRKTLINLAEKYIKVAESHNDVMLLGGNLPYPDDIREPSTMISNATTIK